MVILYVKGLVTNYGERRGGEATKREGGGACEGFLLRKGGGAQQVSDPQFSHCVPEINDQSLMLSVLQPQIMIYSMV